MYKHLSGRLTASHLGIMAGPPASFSHGALPHTAVKGRVFTGLPNIHAHYGSTLLRPSINGGRPE